MRAKRLQRDAPITDVRRLRVRLHRGRAGSARLDRRRARRLRSGQHGSPGDRAGRPDPRRYSRASLIAVIAATEAWADAGLRLGEPGAGVLVGSGAGGIDVAERQYFEFFTDGWKRVTPYAIPVSIVGMISSEISIALELHGISHVVSTGCTSSTDAISYAAALIRGGEADVLLTRRRRRLRHARHDLRLFEDARRRDPLQRRARRRLAPVRCRARRVRAR